MNVTPEVVDKVTAYVKDKTSPLAQILADLNTPAISNPSPQGVVKQPVTFAALTSVLEPASLGKLMTYVHLNEVIADLRRNDLDAAALWVEGLTAAGILTPADATAIGGVLSGTVLDPAWKPQLSWAEANLGGPLTAIDIQDCAKYGKWPTA